MASIKIEKTKTLFLQLIHDNEVRKALSDLLRPSIQVPDCNDIVKPIEQQDLLLVQQSNYLSTALENRDRENEIAALKEVVRAQEQQLNNAMDKLSAYHTTYSNLEDAYRLFADMNTSVLNMFDQIVSTASPLAFLVSGTDYGKLCLFYEKILMTWKTVDKSSLEILNRVFDYLFNQYRAINTDLKRIPTNVGDEFSESVHIRTPDSKPTGVIAQVIICGFKDETGARTKKSYVRLDR